MPKLHWTHAGESRQSARGLPGHCPSVKYISQPWYENGKLCSKLTIIPFVHHLAKIRTLFSQFDHVVILCVEISNPKETFQWGFYQDNHF